MVHSNHKSPYRRKLNAATAAVEFTFCIHIVRLQSQIALYIYHNNSGS